MFTVGDRIRRTTDPVRAAPIGFETVVVEPEFNTGADRVWYRGRDGDTVHGDINAFELIQDSPIRTVTRQEIIPGTYDGVVVGEVVSHERPRAEVPVTLSGYMDHAALTRAAAVLTALAGALRDGN